MIRRLFKDPDIEKRSSWDIDTIEEDFEMDSSNLWDTHVDTLKRRLNKFKKISETKNTGGRSSSINSGVARLIHVLNITIYFISILFRQIHKRGSSVSSNQLNFPRTSRTTSDISTLRSSLRKSLKSHLDNKYKKNSCSSLQTNSTSRYSELSQRLSLDLQGNRFLYDEETGAIHQIVVNQPMSSKRKRSRRYGLSFHELNDTTQENVHHNFSYLNDNAVSTF